MSAVDVITERRPFFTPKTLAAYLSVSERTVRSMLAKGTIPSYLIEGSRRIDPADVDAYLTSRRTMDDTTKAGPACANTRAPAHGET